MKDAYKAWSEDKAPMLGAALAYFAVFSLAPLLVIAIAIAGIVFGEEAARGQISAEITKLVGTEAATAIEGMVKTTSEKGGSPIAAVIGVFTLLLGASGVFGQLKEAMNLIWDVEPTKKQGLLHTLKSRFVSLAMVFGTGFLLLVSLVLSAGVSAFVSFAGSADFLRPVLYMIDFIVSVGLITFLFAALFKFLPDAVVQWRDVWIGAFFTSLLFAIGKILLGLYLGRSGVASGFGAAGSVILILLWTYYASQILFFGAEITKAYADRFGSRISPVEDN